MLKHVLMTLALCAGSTTVMAQTRSQVYGGGLDKQTMTTYVRADVGFNTYDSKTIDSKETKSTNTYSAGVFAGERRNFGMVFSSNENSVPFSLNDSRVTSAFRDVKAKARLGWAYPTVAASLAEIKVEKADTTLANVSSSGTGAGLGVELPLHEKIVVFGEGMTYRSMNNRDITGNDMKIGPRTEIDAGASVDLTERMLDFLVGYRVRSYSLEANDVTSKEGEAGAYVGLRLGLYF